MPSTGTRETSEGAGPVGGGVPGEPLEWTRLLASAIGPRRPTGPGEAQAARSVAGGLTRLGCDAWLAPFHGYSTFAAPYGVALAAALAGPALSSRASLPVRIAAGALGPALTAAEDGLVMRPLSSLLSRRWSANVVAEVPSERPAARTVCLVSHLDSSRSGLLFHPRFLPWLHRWIGLQGAALGAGAVAPALGRSRAARVVMGVSRGVLAGALGLLAERELRGRDVPGANDNATGVGVVATLLGELAAAPLADTRVVGLFTGCEESGLRGAEAFLRALEAGRAPAAPGESWRSWLFVNFDGVGAPATLRYLRREGILRRWEADPGLIKAAEGVARRRPELALAAQDRNAGLTYDVTPVLARGGRALTISAQDRTIPNYHTPSDTVENLDPDALARALEVGRELLAALDRGEADEG